MTSQLRIYTINRGMMDEWVKLFTETIVPIQEKHGIKIEGMWVSEDSTQFIWIRSFTNSEDQGGRVLRVSGVESCNGPRAKPYSEDGRPNHGTGP